MSTGEVIAVVLSVVGTLTAAGVIGGVKWALTANRLLGKVTELVDRVAELAELAQDTAVLRADFAGHCRQSDERWQLIMGGKVPYPRAPVYEGTDRRRPLPPIVIEASGP